MRHLVLALLVIAGCTSTPPAVRAPDPPTIATHDEERAAPKTEWATSTQSPNDGALEKVAQRIVAHRARGLGAPDVDTVVAWMRMHGEPHVRPRVIAATGQAPLGDDVLNGRIAASMSKAGLTRYAVARGPLPHGGEVATAIVLDALADLSPLPTRARTGEWLAFEAKLHVPAQEATLVILGPRGVPRTVPTSFDRTTRKARAKFALDRPGAFSVQLVADLPAQGPRPVLEARVFADAEPPADPEALPSAPGEDGAGDDVAKMIAALRASESLRPLVHDDRLDAIARAHAERMRDAGTVAHDLGEGDLRARFAEAGLEARGVGENVARGATIISAHRAIYASPSHRLNLLRADYTHFGWTAVRSDDGFYLCEVFASGLLR